MLTALSSHYWRPDFSPAQAGSLIADYCEDLADCMVAEIEIAIREYRRSNQKFFPKIGQLRDIIAANRKHRADLEKVAPAKLQFGDTRPIMWWRLPRALWQRHWRVSDIPAGETTPKNQRAAE